MTALTDNALREIQHTKSNIYINPNNNPLSTKPTKWSNTLKQFVANLPTNCLSVFDHFVGLALKGIIKLSIQR